MATNEALGALSGVAWWATERALLSIGLYIGCQLGNVRAGGLFSSLDRLEVPTLVTVDHVLLAVLVDADDDGVELACAWADPCFVLAHLALRCVVDE